MSATESPFASPSWDGSPEDFITFEQAREVAANWRDTTQLANALDATVRVAELCWACDCVPTLFSSSACQKCGRTGTITQEAFLEIVKRANRSTVRGDE